MTAAVKPEYANTQANLRRCIREAVEKSGPFLVLERDVEALTQGLQVAVNGWLAGVVDDELFELRRAYDQVAAEIAGLLPDPHRSQGKCLPMDGLWQFRRVIVTAHRLMRKVEALCAEGDAAEYDALRDAAAALRNALNGVTPEENGVESEGAQ